MLDMRRREFISLLGGAAAAWPLAARAQQPGKLPTIGFLGASTVSMQGPRTAAFVQRLRELGWIEGRTFVIEVRWAEGRSERAAEIAAEFVRLKVDIVIAAGTALTLAAKQATSTIPIVFTGAGDPVATGLVASCGIDVPNWCFEESPGMGAIHERDYDNRPGSSQACFSGSRH
jgi:putative ABC transport system substrate-binding protein